MGKFTNTTVWSIEEDNILIENWNKVTNNKDLMLLLKDKTSALIYKRATKLGLSRKKQYPHRILVITENKADILLALYSKYRNITRALKETNMHFNSLKKLYETNAAFNSKYKAIKKSINNTFICKYCEECSTKTDKNIGELSIVCEKCIDIQKNVKLNKGREYIKTLRGKLSSILNKAKTRKNVDTEITVDYLENLYNLQKGKCYYLDIDMKINSEISRDFYLMSIDRLDSNKTYTKDNIVLCCWGINNIKNDYKFENFVIFCRYIGEKFKDIL
jgi:hypothetical protein